VAKTINPEAIAGWALKAGFWGKERMGKGKFTKREEKKTLLKGENQHKKRLGGRKKYRF